MITHEPNLPRRGSIPLTLPWRLQHYTEPAPILCEEERRLVIDTGDGFEGRNRRLGADAR